MAFILLYNYFLQDTKVTPFKDDCKLLCLITTIIITSYILRIKKVQEMDRWNHSGALWDHHTRLESNLKKKKRLDR